MAKSANIDLKLSDFTNLSHLPILLNMKPHGNNMMYHLHTIGGMSILLKYLINNNIINGDQLTVTGKTLSENLAYTNIDKIDNNIIHTLENPFIKSAHINILHGNLAPEGCITKINSNKRYFTGFAKVFNNEKDMLTSLENNEINSENFVIIRYQGESVGCPEMLKPTSAIAGYFNNNNLPALATDGRFSGGSHGILVCHLPDAYKKGNLTQLIMNGDKIIMNLEKGTITLDVSENEINDRQTNHIQQSPKLFGFLKKYSKTVGSITSGYLGGY